MMMSLSLALSQFRGGGGVDPVAEAVASITAFHSGVDGYAFIPSPTTCFTDTSRTTPAGVGDSVAGMTDLSGNGYHALQAGANAVPTLEQDANGRYYLQYTAADPELLQLSGSPSWVADAQTLYYAGDDAASGTDNQYVLDVTNGRLIVGFRGSDASPAGFDGANWTGTGLDEGTPHTLIFRSDTTNSVVRGNDGTTAASVSPSVTPVNRAVGGTQRLGRASSGSIGQLAGGRIYAVGLKRGAASDAELDALEADLATLLDLTLA
jgi:hypothetical protein